MWIISSAELLPQIALIVADISSAFICLRQTQSAVSAGNIVPLESETLPKWVCDKFIRDTVLLLALCVHEVLYIPC